MGVRRKRLSESLDKDQLFQQDPQDQDASSSFHLKKKNYPVLFLIFWCFKPKIMDKFKALFKPTVITTHILNMRTSRKHWSNYWNLVESSESVNRLEYMRCIERLDIVARITTDPHCPLNLHVTSTMTNTTVE